MITQDELEFVYYKLGTSGSFRTALYDLYPKADVHNRIKLLSVFPYLQVIEDYLSKDDYWQDLQRRYVEYVAPKVN